MKWNRKIWQQFVTFLRTQQKLFWACTKKVKAKTFVQIFLNPFRYLVFNIHAGERQIILPKPQQFANRGQNFSEWNTNCF